MAEQKDYIVSGYLTISVTKVIRAGSPEEAKAKAAELSAPSLCHQCEDAGDGYDDSWTLNGFDDPPDDCVDDVREVE